MRTTFDFGVPRNEASAANPADDGLTQSQRRVFELIQGGTTKRSDIVAACPGMSPATVDRALDTLSGHGRIERAGQGRYSLVEQSAPEPV